MTIFISHASADKALADKLVDLLQTGMDLSARKIFCTSLDGMGIPHGLPFIAYIKEKLEKAEFVIALITPSFYESAFCLCELGATWLAKEDRFFPLLVPPLDYDDLKAVLDGVQVGYVDDKKTLNALCDRLEDAGLAKKLATSRWEAKRDEHLAISKRLIKKLKGYSSVSAKKYDELDAKYNALLESLGEKDEELSELKSQIDALKKLKDKELVKIILKKSSSARAEFDSLTEEFKAIDIPNAVVECLFFERMGDQWRPSNEEWESVERAIARGFLSNDHGIVSTADHQRVSKAEQKLEEISNFLHSEEAVDLVESLKEEKEYPIRLSNRDFWEDYLGL